MYSKFSMREIDIQNKEDRFERKFSIINIDISSLENKLYRSPLFFKTQYINRFVNSIYFDDIKFNSFRENIEGQSYKTKYRLRWYNNRHNITDPIFEIKKKNYFNSIKIKKNIDKLDGLDFSQISQISNIINENLNIKKKLFARKFISYERKYFISNDHKIRLTIDFNINSKTIKDNIIFDKNNFRSSNILEIKYPTNLDNFVRLNLKSLSLRFVKNSKYVNSYLF